MDAQTIGFLSASIAVLGTITTGWLGYRAKQAESRIAAQTKVAEVAAGTTLNERQEATAIRVAQREEIKELRERLDHKDQEIDALQDANRKLTSQVDRLEATVERLERELARARGTAP